MAQAAGSVCVWGGCRGLCCAEQWCGRALLATCAFAAGACTPCVRDTVASCNGVPRCSDVEVCSPQTFLVGISTVVHRCARAAEFGGIGIAAWLWNLLGWTQPRADLFVPHASV